MVRVRSVSVIQDISEVTDMTPNRAGFLVIPASNYGVR